MKLSILCIVAGLAQASIALAQPDTGFVNAGTIATEEAAWDIGDACDDIYPNAPRVDATLRPLWAVPNMRKTDVYPILQVGERLFSMGAIMELQPSVNPTENLPETWTKLELAALAEESAKAVIIDPVLTQTTLFVQIESGLCVYIPDYQTDFFVETSGG